MNQCIQNNRKKAKNLRAYVKLEKQQLYVYGAIEQKEQFKNATKNYLHFWGYQYYFADSISSTLERKIVVFLFCEKCTLFICQNIT